MDLGITLVVLVILLALIWRFLGAYMAAVYEGRVTWLAWAERPIYRVLGVDAEAEQSWKSYAVSLIVFSGVAILITYGIIRLQGHLPLNPAHQGAVSQGVSWNTAVSFVTNTNWQAYSGESTMSYLSQMGALAVQNFLSAAVGIAVAVALIRGFARRGSGTIGNFWVDLVRGTLYILLPVSILITLVFMGEGAIQTLGGPVSIHDHLSGFKQTLPRGPFASQEVIKELGTNGGGTYNANGAITLENPTGVTNLLSVLLILSIPVALTYTFGKMVGRVREGVAVLAAMTVIFAACLTMTAVAEAQPSRAVTAAGLPHQPLGNTEGKEARFGTGSSALYNITSTQTSTGSVDSSMDSYTPIGGLGALSGMMLGEVSPGGVGSGLYTILLSAIITVFIGGLMIGRTPEYLGKKIQAKEVKLAGLGVLIMPITVLVLTAIAVSVHDGSSVTNNNGAHGFSEILYAFTSMANNNGSAFAGLTVTNAFYTILGGVAMLIGRFGIIIPVLALAGTLAAKQKVATSIGTFRTDSTLFTGLLIGVIIIIGGLTFFPAVALGPLADQLSHGRLF